jgi:serine/threonine protein kinase/tetratricopeptide (TPR) repeat protein
MSSENWSKVKALFDAAVELEPAQRNRFLDRSCGSNAELRREVESLLHSFERSDSFLEQPAANQVASIILEPKDVLGEGDSFAHYKIVRRIGVGGMGEVYLAEDAKLDRYVAIKILNEQFSKHDSHLERFVREAKAASSLNHPNILVIHEIGMNDDANYIVSEFVDGKTLRELMGGPRLSLRTVLDISIQIAGALQAAHGAGIAHRDIKPENIVVRPDGYAKVLDFGLAKLLKPENLFVDGDKETAKLNRTAQGMIMGTVNYMSPEQAKGETVDERTDIFSLGVVIYELLTGSTPFQGDSMSESFANLINVEPQPIGRAANVPDELQRIVSKTLQKDKRDRYQTAADLLIDLKNLRDTIVFSEKFGSLSPIANGNSKDGSSRPMEKLTGTPNNTVAGRMTWSTTTAAIVGSLIIIAAIAGGYFFYLRGSATGNNGHRSLAVLPFTNVSQDPNAEYLADGVTESIINNLSQLSGLKVMSRNSAFRFKGDQSDVRTIASKLNVDTLVTGDVKQIGDKLVINVRLTNAADDSQIWGNQYVRTLTDVITAQNEIAQAVAQNLKVQLTSTDTKHLSKRYTENPEAYQAYLRGRFHIFKLTPDEIQQGISYLQQAIDLDPSYAIAYGGLADAYRSLAVGSEITPVEYLAKSKAAAKKAIEIDDTLSDGHAALGMTMFWGDWDWAAAENEFKRALELNPNDVNAHLFYAHLLSNTGRHSEALSEVSRARELDPLFPFAGALEGQFLVQAGKPDEGLDRLKKTFELAPNFWMPHLFAAVAYVDKGMFAEAIIEARKSKQLPGTSTFSTAVESYALAKAGHPEEAKKAMDELFEISTKRFMPPTHIALAYNGLGETQKALDWLEKGFEERDPKMAFLKIDPKLNNLRSEPRFVELMKRMNF